MRHGSTRGDALDEKAAIAFSWPGRWAELCKQDPHESKRFVHNVGGPDDGHAV